ncbi:Dihydrolipoyllysine-residue acetyltransferase component 4 of pyruvate dehydrogenase complex [Hibiscus syriacus]|uniref:Dihydrolipoyllysine-residue acetyltransferase component 4 of pyruvate dehydrogenase complex n=1 Tax=Hibiscus syriacus TaxID=106335 RepID=A0A6A3ABK9_HIBSY|nr:Dihydrolipoyllysine-residue acetyltransferase component 4 of pyruvate dehydrogenase complex [Hibiscus syriacus]
MDVESFHEGFLAAIMVDEGGVAPVGSAIALLAETEDEIAEAKAKSQSSSSSSHQAVEEQPKQIEEAAPALPAAAPVASASTVSASKTVALGSAVHPASEGGKRIVASPYAKKLAKELKVDLGTLVGLDPWGGLWLRTLRQRPQWVQRLRKQGAVSRNMVESLSVPTFRVGYTITTNALDALYKKIKSKGVTMTTLFAKATALALAQHPVVNSCCRDGNTFTYNSSINIAVAVAIDGGLITPVLQDADKVDIYTLSRKWKELVDKARAKQLQHHEYSTGTFTLSNLGMFGVDRFDAILPPGTGAIMAVGASQPTVVASKDGRIGMKNQMQVNVTADHQVIYGADLAAFLQTLAKIVEDPKDLTF